MRWEAGGAPGLEWATIRVAGTGEAWRLRVVLVRLDPARFPGSGYLHWVGVHAAHRGRRLGYVISLAVLHRFRALGCRDAVLETDPPRLPAIRTYLRLGLRPEPAIPAHEEMWPALLAQIDAASPARE